MKKELRDRYLEEMERLVNEGKDTVLKRLLDAFSSHLLEDARKKMKVVNPKEFRRRFQVIKEK
ncbi:MAG: hypothetical protein ACYS0I_16020 [Planctomycetota bacterium]